MRNIIVFVFIGAILTGCTSAKDIRYLTPQEAKKYPVVMIANSDIICGKSKIVKGTIFIVKEVGGYKYKIWSKNTYRNYGLMFGKKKVLPKDALFIKLQEDYSAGFIVYPNGQFVYDNYYEFTFDKSGNFQTLVNQKCTFNALPPFTLKHNR